MSQTEAWEEAAEHWLALVRGPDEFHAYNSRAFFELLPPPSGRALDLGCGEGRLARELKSRGYDVVGIDASPTLVRLAREADPGGEYHLSDAGALPFADATFELVIPFMSLQDMDDAAGALREGARVLAPGGRLCLAVLHPLRTAGVIDEEAGTLTISRSYFETARHVRPGIQVPNVHHPLETYFGALEEAGLVVEAVRELASRQARLKDRIPACLHLRALKP